MLVSPKPSIYGRATGVSDTIFGTSLPVSFVFSFFPLLDWLSLGIALPLAITTFFH